MKLPRFLRIDPDFKRAVDVYPNKGDIKHLSVFPNTIFFGDDPYFNPTWAEVRYALKTRSKYLAERENKTSAENAVLHPQRNKELLRKILSLE